MQLTHDATSQIGVGVPRETIILDTQYLPGVVPMKKLFKKAGFLNSFRNYMAGAAGFEPTHGGIKTCCLTR